MLMGIATKYQMKGQKQLSLDLRWNYISDEGTKVLKITVKSVLSNYDSMRFNFKNSISKRKFDVFVNIIAPRRPLILTPSK